MTIDIISYTQEQFAALNAEQIDEVRRVQLQKNRLLRSLERKKVAEKYRLSANGVFRSSIYTKLCEIWQSEYDEEIEALRDGLLFYLQYSGQKSNAGAGYTVDYSLSVVDRAVLVKDYYERTYSDPQERFNMFKKDTIAPTYLCEAYSSLYHYFWVDTQENATTSEG